MKELFLEHLLLQNGVPIIYPAHGLVQIIFAAYGGLEIASKQVADFICVCFYRMDSRFLILAMDSYKSHLLLTEGWKLASKQVADFIRVRESRFFILAMDSFKLYLRLTEVWTSAFKQVADFICVCSYRTDSRLFILAMDSYKSHLLLSGL